VVLPPDAPGWFLATLLGAITLQAFLWYGLVALAASAGRVKRLGADFGRGLRRLAGVTMLAFAARLLAGLRRDLSAAS